MPQIHPLLKQGEINSRKRATAPVFVLGCPRSGTTVLYHMLLSAGNFAVYRAESNVFSVLRPRFGNLRYGRNRRRLMDAWLKSKLFHVSGLDARKTESLIMRECRSEGDFLRLIMEQIARTQGAQRWADCTPDHLLYIRQIKQQIPDALIIHIIRDGRDVALSYCKQGWAHPLAWDRNESLSVAGLYREWIVKAGRKYGQRLGSDYQEVRFEDLVTAPRRTLAGLCEFIGQDLDYERIQRAGIGSVSTPNSSFVTDFETSRFDPVGRWKTKMSAKELTSFEALVGDYLSDLGYSLATSGQVAAGVRLKCMRLVYRTMFGCKHWMKNTPLGRFVKVGRMQMTDEKE